MDEKIIGKMRNNWRRRRVTIYEIPDDPMHVHTIGISFDEGVKPVDVIEDRESWERTIKMYPRVDIYD